MIKILLTNSEKFAIIDDRDFSKVKDRQWCLADGNHVRSANGVPQIFLHHLIAGMPPPGKMSDHKNTNGLDNRRRNLRFTTCSGNSCNRGKQKNNTSGFKGVFWNKSHEKWGVSIGVRRKYTFIGYFSDPIEAAKAYDAAAKKHHGRFARPNFPMRFPRLHQ